MTTSIYAASMVALALAAPGAVHDYSPSGNMPERFLPAGGDAGSGYGSYGRKRSKSRSLNPATTTAIVRSMEAATRYCEWVEPKEYVIDCLSERLDDVKKGISGKAGYDDVRAVLADSSRKLRDIARRNRSQDLPRTRFKREGPDAEQTNRALVAVDSARLDGAAAQALTVIREAETRLLRSSNDAATRAQFQQIASAMGSNKVLLRSI